jgi:hypothetical protein
VDSLRLQPSGTADPLPSHPVTMDSLRLKPSGTADPLSSRYHGLPPSQTFWYSGPPPLSSCYR